MKISKMLVTGVLCTASAMVMAQETGAEVDRDPQAQQQGAAGATDATRTDSERRMADASNRGAMNVDSPEFAKKAAAISRMASAPMDRASTIWYSSMVKSFLRIGHRLFLRAS